MNVSPAVQNKIGTAMIVHPTLTPDEFLETVLDEFEVPCRSDRRQWRLEALLNMLLEIRRRNGVAVLVIDEAQLLSPEVLEEVNTLLTLQTSREKLLQIVLCGQPELEAKLAGMTLRRAEPFVAVRCGTAALSLQDTHDYVEHRLRIAGARTEGLFRPAAVDAVHLHTAGIPRLINLLCGQALSVASDYRASRVFPYMVDQAAGELCSGALVDADATGLLRSLPLPAEEAPKDSSNSVTSRCNGASATGIEAPSKIEHGDRGLPEEMNESTGPEPGKADEIQSPHSIDTDSVSGEVRSVATALGTDMCPGADSILASPVVRTSERTPTRPSRQIPEDDGSPMRLSRRKRRALRHRAKLARSTKLAQIAGTPVVKCDFTDGCETEVSFRRPGYRPSPFRRGRPRPSRLRLRRVSVAHIAGSLPVWNQWLNRWCSEHFNSKSCGKPLFQLGLAGTLFLALAQVIAAGLPWQHLAHVTFGFLGLLFIDISLGLGTYLLLIERRLTPGSRGGWTQTLKRRLG
jgi:hypothetical protein